MNHLYITEWFQISNNNNNNDDDNNKLRGNIRLDMRNVQVV